MNVWWIKIDVAWECLVSKFAILNMQIAHSSLKKFLLERINSTAKFIKILKGNLKFWSIGIQLSVFECKFTEATNTWVIQDNLVKLHCKFLLMVKILRWTTLLEICIESKLIHTVEWWSCYFSAFTSSHYEHIRC